MKIDLSKLPNYELIQMGETLKKDIDYYEMFNREISNGSFEVLDSPAMSSAKMDLSLIRYELDRRKKHRMIIKLIVDGQRIDGFYMPFYHNFRVFKNGRLETPLYEYLPISAKEFLRPFLKGKKDFRLIRGKNKKILKEKRRVQMAVELKIGTRGTRSEINYAFTEDFLEEHGISKAGSACVHDFDNRCGYNVDCYVIKTKNGFMASLDSQDMLTYMGNNVWNLKPTEMSKITKKKTKMPLNPDSSLDLDDEPWL